MRFLLLSIIVLFLLFKNHQNFYENVNYTNINKSNHVNHVNSLKINYIDNIFECSSNLINNGYSEYIDFFYDARNINYNNQAFSDCLMYINEIIDATNRMNNEKRNDKQLIDIIIDSKKKCMNSFHSILYSIPVNVNKNEDSVGHTFYMNKLHKIINNHLHNIGVNDVSIANSIHEPHNNDFF